MLRATQLPGSLYIGGFASTMMSANSCNLASAPCNPCHFANYCNSAPSMNWTVQQPMQAMPMQWQQSDGNGNVYVVYAVPLGMQLVPPFQNIPPQVTAQPSVNIDFLEIAHEPKMLSLVAQYLGISFLRAGTTNKQWFAVAVSMRQDWLEHCLAQYCECGKVEDGTVEPCRWGCKCTRGNDRCKFCHCFTPRAREGVRIRVSRKAKSQRMALNSSNSRESICSISSIATRIPSELD